MDTCMSRYGDGRQQEPEKPASTNGSYLYRVSDNHILSLRNVKTPTDTLQLGVSLHTTNDLRALRRKK